jgi:NADP-dependent 3-hydroxy acid dehydrogenase YdfG
MTTDSRENQVVALVGMGPGVGEGVARKFTEAGHPVAMLGRSAERLAGYEASISGTKAFVWDVTDAAAAEAVFADVQAQLGPVTTLIYNPAWRGFKAFEESTLAELDQSWATNARGLFIAAKQVLPAMLEAGHGHIIVSGATASLRGMPSSITFAPAKAGARMLAQSLAREFGPKGIHIASVVIDGVINHPRMREIVPDKPDSFFLEPADIAEAYYMLTQQPRSAWTFELDLRPFGEKW